MPILSSLAHSFAENAYADLRKWLSHVHDDSKELDNQQIVFNLGPKLSPKTMIHRQEYNRIKRRNKESKSSKGSGGRTERRSENKTEKRDKKEDGKERDQIEISKNIWELLPLLEDNEPTEFTEDDLIQISTLVNKYQEKDVNGNEIVQDISNFSGILYKFYMSINKSTKFIITYSDIVRLSNIGINKTQLINLMVKLYQSTENFLCERKQKKYEIKQTTDVSMEIYQREVIIENQLNEIHSLKQKMSKISKSRNNTPLNKSRSNSIDQMEDFNSILAEHERCVKMLTELKQIVLEKDKKIKEISELLITKETVIKTVQTEEKLKTEYDKTIIKIKGIVSKNEELFDKYKIYKVDLGPLVAIPELIIYILNNIKKFVD